ncbi:hypothetical protein Tco_1546462 [Tanacetum coccineum]
MQGKGVNDSRRYRHSRFMESDEVYWRLKEIWYEVAVCDNEDEIKEGASKLYKLITGVDKNEVSTTGDAGEFALMGVTSERSYSNDFASSDSSVKSSEPKSNDSTSCASTSSISTSESEAEIESNVGTPIQETINVQDLTYFPSDKEWKHTRTSCNKNGYINKKAGHFRKNASSISKLCFVCGSSTHLINDCDFYEKQMANKTVGNGVGPVHSRNNINHQNQYVPHAVLLRTRKVNITPARPQPVPTGKPKVPTPVPTGRKILIQMLKIHTDDNVANLLTKAFDGPRVWVLVNHHTTNGVPTTKSHRPERVDFTMRLKVMCIRFMCSIKNEKQFDVAGKYHISTSRYVVPTGGVVVPTGRYKVPAGTMVIIIVSTGS